MDIDSNNRSTELIQPQDSSDSLVGTNTKWDTIRGAVKRYYNKFNINDNYRL